MQFLGSLKPDERKLFHDRLRTVDRRLAPALSKLTWQRPKAALDSYFNEAMWCANDSASCCTQQTCDHHAHASALSMPALDSYFVRWSQVMQDDASLVAEAHSCGESIRQSGQHVG